jgi:aldose 1-epimerase
MKLDTKDFTTTINGKAVSVYLLKAGALQVAITNYGARIVDISFPDHQGRQTEVNVGYPSIEDYRSSSEDYYGAIIGRFANRIKEGRFSLNKKNYQLPVNNGPNHLHGGFKGFHNTVWEVQSFTDTGLVLQYVSEDGEEGYPGKLTTTLTYQLTEDNSLRLSYGAITDAATIINLTAHPYFNLNGIGSGSINGHLLQIVADYYVPIDEFSIPIGELEKVEGTPFDFRAYHTIGSRIEEKDTQLENGAGYDHNYVLTQRAAWETAPVAVAAGDSSRIRMEVYTDQPGLQLYSGNFMKGANTVNGAFKDAYRTAFCLETQHYPDSPNQPSFPSTVLQPGEVFSSATIYRFSLMP